MAQFSHLPNEIPQLQIFELADRDCLPRVVEIYVKAGQIYSKSLPPPLLHVCQLSRWVVLKRYKPWLPQFKDKPWYKPYERVVKKYGHKLSRLNNVCVDFHRDTVLVSQHQWAAWNFGFLEKHNLRYLALDLGGWLDWSEAVVLLQQFRRLRKARLFDSSKGDTQIDLKASQIIRGITKSGEQCAKKRLAYSAPLIEVRVVPGGSSWDEAVDKWITYKYPKGYLLQRANHRAEHHLEGKDRLTGIFAASQSAANFLDRKIKLDQGPFTDPSKIASTRISLPAQFLNTTKSQNFSSRILQSTESSIQPITLNMGSFVSTTSNSVSRKRKRNEDFGSASSFHKDRNLVENTSQRTIKYSSDGPVTVVSPGEETEDYTLDFPLVMPDLEDFEPSSQEPYMLPPITVKNAFSSHTEEAVQDHSFLPDDVVSGIGSPQASWEAAADLSFADIFKDIELWCTPSPEPEAEEFISSPMDLNSSPFQSPSKSSDRPDRSIPAIGPLAYSPSFIDSSTGFFDLFPYDDAEPLDGLVPAAETVPNHQALSFWGSADQSCFVGVFSEEIASTKAPVEQVSLPRQSLQNNIRKSNPENALAKDTLQTDSTAPVAAEDSIHSEKHRKSLPVVEIRVQNSTVLFPGVSKVEPLPVGMIAERLVAGDLEYLVKWGNNTPESWVREEIMMSIAPGLMEEWKTMKTQPDDSSDGNPPLLEYVVEKILSKKSIEGAPSYLVKWEGYPKVEDRTWEPCDRLRVDVPMLVEDYELNKRRRKRRRRS